MAGRREEGGRKKKLLPQKLMLLVSAGVHSQQPCEEQAGWTCSSVSTTPPRR